MINTVIKGLMESFLRSGIEVKRLDLSNEQLYISLPEKSYIYKEDPYLENAGDYAKRIKDCFIQWGLFSEDGQVKYKTRKTAWTETDSRIAWNVDGWRVRNGTLWEGKIIGL